MFSLLKPQIRERERERERERYIEKNQVSVDEFE